MKNKGLPFILGITEAERYSEVARGVRVSLIGEIHKGDYKGVLAGGVTALTNEGVRQTGNQYNGQGNLSGIYLGGLATNVSGCLDGVSAGLINIVEQDLNGVSVGLINHTKGNRRLAVQIGLYNRVEENWAGGAVLQIGIYNRIGEQTIPLVNIRGLVDLYRRG